MTDPNQPASPAANVPPAPTPPAAPPAYGAAPTAPPVYPAAAPGGYPPAPSTNTLAIVSLISSLVGVFIIPVIGQIVGVITGHISLGQIKHTGEGGRGLALAGVIVGWVSMGLWIIGIVLFVMFFITLASASYTFT
ncbi:hypothetical protein GCM10009808_08940 [Microbacterium sediminicola]|uniref:DUF4190 domain-containing protein n=1 Tax=Microbacterium sediminicola TaxID=415210 RepID=A0ABP4TWD8_9MICO